MKLKILWWDLPTEELIARLEYAHRFMSQFSAKQQREMLEDAGRAMAAGIAEGIESSRLDQKDMTHGNH